MMCLQLMDLISCAEVACVRGAGTCGLEHLGIFLVDKETCEPLGPDMWLDCGIPMAYKQGAEGVCTAIGDLVQRRILPALKEVCIAPALCGHGRPSSIHISMHSYKPKNIHSSFCHYRSIATVHNTLVLYCRLSYALFGMRVWS